MFLFLSVSFYLTSRFFVNLEVTDHLFSFLFHFFLFLVTVSKEVYFSITSLISFHSFQICIFLFIFECFSCCSCFTFIFILKGTRHQSNHHEEARATTKIRSPKRREKIRKTTPTPKKGRQGTPLLYFKVHNCPIWFYLIHCLIPFHFISSHTGVRQHHPKGGGGKQHHPKEVEGRGDAAPTPEEGKQGQQPLYFYLPYLYSYLV